MLLNGKLINYELTVQNIHEMQDLVTVINDNNYIIFFVYYDQSTPASYVAIKIIESNVKSINIVEMQNLIYKHVIENCDYSMFGIFDVYQEVITKFIELN